MDEDGKLVLTAELVLAPSALLLGWTAFCFLKERDTSLSWTGTLLFFAASAVVAFFVVGYMRIAEDRKSRK